MNDTIQPVYSRYDAERLNERKGFYWFTPGTMRFFNTRISECTFFLGDGETFFVTSEQAPRSFEGTSASYQAPRMYSVRAINWESGNVRTVGEFQEYSNRNTAVRWAKREAEGQKAAA